MAKVITKGSILSLASGTTYTPIAQVISYSMSGMQTETYDSRTIDGTAGIEYDPTGYVEGGSTTFELFHDWALTGHQDIHDLITAACLLTTGLPNKTNWKLVAPNTNSSQITMVAAGVGIDITGEMSSGIKASVSLKHSGCPVLTT